MIEKNIEYKMIGLESLPLYVLKIEYPSRIMYEMYTTPNTAFQRYFTFKGNENKHRIEKLELRAIYGVLDFNTLKGLERKEPICLDNLTETIRTQFDRGELLAIYPKLEKLNQLLPLTAQSLSEQTGLSERVCEDIMIIKGRMHHLRKPLLYRLCRSLNLSIFLFIDDTDIDSV